MAEPKKRRHESLIPLSHDHHHGLVVALRLREGYARLEPRRAGEGVESLVKETEAFYQSSLMLHFQVEEEILFPALRPFIREDDTVIEELLADHEQIRSLVARVGDQTDQALRRHLTTLGELLERHIRREERELFPIFEERLSAERADQIGREIALALGRAQTP